MADQLNELLEQWGVWGVLVSLFIEGSAFPFIGTFFIVTVGFVLELTWFEIAWISVFGGFLYALGSYIPYYAGYALGGTVLNRLGPANRARFEKMMNVFSKYGIWSVAIASPLHLGNVVPFVAGISQMKLSLYTALTMLGITPSTFLLLSGGRLYPGDPDDVLEMIGKYQEWVLVGFAIMTAAFIGWKLRKARLDRRAGQQHEEHPHS